MKRYLTIGTCLFALLFLTGCTSKKIDAKYIGYFYPNMEDMDKDWVESGPLNSLYECQEWAKREANAYANKISAKYGKRYDYNYGYVCGKNCRLGDDYNQGTNYTCQGKEK